MNRCTTCMLAGVTIAALPALAAEVTPERLIKADREPQNWLMCSTSSLVLMPSRSPAFKTRRQANFSNG